jgi:hypothetical protein
MERVMVAAEHFNVISQLLSEVLPQILHYVRRAIISKKWISLIVSAHGQIVFCEIRYLELARAEQALRGSISWSKPQNIITSILILGYKVNTEKM